MQVSISVKGLYPTTYDDVISVKISDANRVLTIIQDYPDRRVTTAWPINELKLWKITQMKQIEDIEDTVQ